MRLFQIGNLYTRHQRVLSREVPRDRGYRVARDFVLSDVSHSQLLLPCLRGSSDAFVSFPQESVSLRLWATEKGMPEGVSRDDIVLAQIEEHNTEVLYTVSSATMTAEFFKRLPSSVKYRVAWLGSPVVGNALGLFDAVVSNFPTINAKHAALGLNTSYLAPSYDPQADLFEPDADWQDRRAEVLFAGGFSRHHKNRALLLHKLSEASLAGAFRLDLYLDPSRFSVIADTPLGFFPPLSAVRRPRAVRALAKSPIFGKNMFGKLCRTKIVINMAIDMAGRDRGNMRCFETLSAGALLLSDGGSYPDGFVDGETMVTYSSIDEALGKISELLNDPWRAASIAKRGARMVRSLYSKERQWNEFKELCGAL